MKEEISIENLKFDREGNAKIAETLANKLTPFSRAGLDAVEARANAATPGP